MVEHSQDLWGRLYGSRAESASPETQERRHMCFPGQLLRLLDMPITVHEADGVQALAIQDQRQAKIWETKGSRIRFEQHETVCLRRSPVRGSPLGHSKPRVYQLCVARIRRPCIGTAAKAALLYCKAVQPASVETNLGFSSTKCAFNN